MLTRDEAGEVMVDGRAVGGYHVERDERGRVVFAAFWGALATVAMLAEVGAAVRAAEPVIVLDAAGVEVDDRAA